MDDMELIGRDPEDANVRLARKGGEILLSLDQWQLLLSISAKTKQGWKAGAGADLTAVRKCKISSPDAKKFARTLHRARGKREWEKGHSEKPPASWEEFDTRAGERELQRVIDFCLLGAFTAERT